jgi:molybdate transport system ATP-binding protein
MADALIVDIEKRFPTGVSVAASLRAELRPGEIFVLFGPSGSGKTTVLRSIAGLERPERGRIEFGGRGWFEAEKSLFVEPQQRGAVYVGQDSALFPHLTVARNVEYGIQHLAAYERNARLTEIVPLVELDGLADRYPRQLSFGQAQRAALARALARHPRLLLLDEPFAALDQPLRLQLRRMLRASIERLGTSVVLVTHDRHDAMALGDGMAVLADGRIRQIGSVPDVFGRPVDLAVAHAVGIDSVVPGRIERLQDGLVDLHVPRGILRAVGSGLDAASSEAFACIRAEDVTLEQGSHADASARNHVSGQIVRIESEGPVERVTIDCGFPLTALVTGQARQEMGLEVGSPVIAAIKATAIHLVART